MTFSSNSSSILVEGMEKEAIIEVGIHPVQLQVQLRRGGHRPSPHRPGQKCSRAVVVMGGSPGCGENVGRIQICPPSVFDWDGGGGAGGGGGCYH